jgi:hypothetical protein
MRFLRRWIISVPWICRHLFPPKLRYLSTTLHDVTCHETVIFIITALKAPNLTTRVTVVLWFLANLTTFSQLQKLQHRMRKWLLARWFLPELISSTLKMKAICSSETPVDTQRTTRRYIPEDGTLHNHRCENLKSYMISFLWWRSRLSHDYVFGNPWVLQNVWSA